MSAKVWWKVKAPLAVWLVEAGSEEQAREKAAKGTHAEHKPYLMRDWEFSIATSEDRRLYKALTSGKPEPTLASAKKAKKGGARQRLMEGL